MQNQQLNNQKMALEGEVIDLRNRLGLSGGQTTTHHRGGHQPYGSSETRDIHKANEIIRKLQDECKSLRNRARSAETALKQLEKVAKETLTSYETLRTELQEARTQLAEKTRTLADTQAERDKLSLEVEETRKLVEANEKVIEWLHQQINEDSISRMLGRTGPGPIGTLPVNLGNGAPFKYTSAPLNRFSPESWLGKAKIPEPASSSSTTPPDHF
jgi:chromosome segregation ATPase